MGLFEVWLAKNGFWDCFAEISLKSESLTTSFLKEYRVSVTPAYLTIHIVSRSIDSM